MACLENVGEISVSESEVKWTIPKFYDLPQEVNTQIKSPRFHYMKEEWQIDLYPNGYFCDSPPGWLGIRAINFNHDINKKVVTIIGIGKESNKPSTIQKGILIAAEIHDDGRCSDMKILPSSVLKSVKESLLPEGNLEVSLDFPDATEFTDEEVSLCVTILTKGDTEIFYKEYAAATRGIEDVGVEKLTHDFKELLRNGNISDFILKAENQEFKAHKCVLAARSPVFMAMMQHETKEKLSDSVDIPDVDPKTVEELLNYLYTGRVDNLNSENVVGLYKAADKYQVSDLKKLCLNHMMKNVSIESFCDALTLSLLHEEKDLKESCIQFFIQNSLDIVLTSKWQTFLTENPIIGNELFVKHLRSSKDSHKS